MTNVRGLWGHEGILYATDLSITHLFAYDLKTGVRDTSKEFNFHSDNASPSYIWGDRVINLD